MTDTVSNVENTNINKEDPIYNITSTFDLNMIMMKLCIGFYIERKIFQSMEIVLDLYLGRMISLNGLKMV